MQGSDVRIWNHAVDFGRIDIGNSFNQPVLFAIANSHRHSVKLYTCLSMCMPFTICQTILEYLS